MDLLFRSARGSEKYYCVELPIKPRKELHWSLQVDSNSWAFPCLFCCSPHAFADCNAGTQHFGSRAVYCSCCCSASSSVMYCRRHHGPSISHIILSPSPSPLRPTIWDTGASKAPYLGTWEAEACIVPGNVSTVSEVCITSLPSGSKYVNNGTLELIPDVSGTGFAPA